MSVYVCRCVSVIYFSVFGGVRVQLPVGCMCMFVSRFVIVSMNGSEIIRERNKNSREIESVWSCGEWNMTCVYTECKHKPLMDHMAYL